MILSLESWKGVCDMPVFMRGNYIFVEPGRKCFEVSSNFTNYLELGIQGITKEPVAQSCAN